MKNQHHRMNSGEGLSQAQKREWDRILDNLQEYFSTPEGHEFYGSFVALMERMQSAQKARSLTESESKALAFIQRKQGQGTTPTTREVAKAAGFRSSRTGHRVMASLRNKAMI